MPKTKIYNRYGFDEFSEKMIQKIQMHILWLHSLISIISSLSMISRNIFQVHLSYTELTELIFLCLIMEELQRARNTERYFTYCSWIGKICIFVTMINSQDNKILQKNRAYDLFSYALFRSFLCCLRILPAQSVYIRTFYRSLIQTLFFLTVILSTN